MIFLLLSLVIKDGKVKQTKCLTVEQTHLQTLPTCGPQLCLMPVKSPRKINTGLQDSLAVESFMSGSAQETEAGNVCELKASQVYITSFRPARAGETLLQKPKGEKIQEPAQFLWAQFSASP